MPSTNPGGRSKELASLQGAARLKAAGHSIEAIVYLLEVLRNKAESTAHRLRAAEQLLNRGMGLPQTQIDIDVVLKRKISEMSLADLRELEDRLGGALTSTAPLLIEGQLAKQSDGSDG
jgi:hypothetical protein